MIKRSSFIVVAALALLACSLSASAQTIYTQTTHQCTMKSCADAQFTPTATLSYIDEADTCGQVAFGASVTWNGIDYTDGSGSMKYLGTSYNGHNYYPFGIYELTITFNGGTATLVEHTKNYRSCSGGVNLDGSVTVQ